MMEKGKLAQGVVELVDAESLVPQKHLLRKVDKAVDFIGKTQPVKRAGGF